MTCLTLLVFHLLLFCSFTYSCSAGPGALSCPPAAPAGRAEGGGEESRGCRSRAGEKNWGAGDLQELAGEGEEGGAGGEQGGLESCYSRLETFSGQTRDVQGLKQRKEY